MSRILPLEYMVVALPALRRELEGRFQAVLHLTSDIWIETEDGGLYEELVPAAHHMWDTLNANIDDLLTLVDFINRSFGPVLAATLASDMLRHRSAMPPRLVWALDYIVTDEPF